jgi:hypothetical protein
MTARGGVAGLGARLELELAGGLELELAGGLELELAGGLERGPVRVRVRSVKAVS